MPDEKGAQLIVEEILEEASDKSAQIIADAKKEAKKLLDAARLKAKEEEDRAIKEAKARGEQVYNEMLAEGRMKAKRETIQGKEEILNEVFKRAEGRLRAYASSEKYDAVNLAIEACKKLGTENVVIYANKKDLSQLQESKDKIAQSIAQDGTAKISFGKPIKTVGGVCVSTHDGKIEIDDTFEGRLKRKFDPLRVKVARILFGVSK